MPFHKVMPGKVADAAITQIESLILRGVLRPGDRLPPERDLAQRMNMSRPSLRKALAELEERGLIVTRRNAGAFVADVLGSAFAPPLVRLFATHREALADYVAFRRDLEGLAAERAAQNASKTDLKVIGAIFAKMEKAHEAHDPEREAEIDADFHMAIVEAGHNVVMLHMMRSMFELLRVGVFYNRQVMFEVHRTRRELLAQHRSIFEAIVARDPAAARAAVEAHLTFIDAALKQYLDEQKHEETARLRIAKGRGR